MIIPAKIGKYHVVEFNRDYDAVFLNICKSSISNNATIRKNKPKRAIKI